MHSRDVEDLTGERFGILTVLSYVGRRSIPCGQLQTIWKCKCDCGSVVNVRAATLKNGDTRSCGCIKSHGEREIAEYLVSKNISYQREYMFADCTNSKGNQCKFDFAVIDGEKLVCLIEYQGEQHFVVPKNTPWFGKMQRDETDKIKEDYCLTHNILLFKIRYDEDIPVKLESIINTLQDNTVPSLS